jgi:hypothetical protein
MKPRGRSISHILLNRPIGLLSVAGQKRDAAGPPDRKQRRRAFEVMPEGTPATFRKTC